VLGVWEESAVATIVACCRTMYCDEVRQAKRWLESASINESSCVTVEAEWILMIVCVVSVLNLFNT
jgi:hypothetical protein